MFAASKTAAVSSAANYIEDVFSTYLYTGTGSAQTITNGIDFSTKGGLLWLKARNDTRNNWLYDTTRSIANGLRSDSTAAATSTPDALTAFNNNGFSIGTSGNINTSGNTLVSWSFEKAPKFFDVVTWTGNGVNDRAISHALGSTPGCIIIKRTDNADDWYVYHRSLASNYWLLLNSSAAQANAGFTWTTVSSTSFTVPSGAGFNASGGSYVAYLFAHNAGGFGLTGTDNVISCGTFDANLGEVINLGYEPQWLLYKASSDVDNWRIADNMRGLTNLAGTNAQTIKQLRPNSSAVESENSGPVLTSTGFTWNQSGGGVTHIYIAIRRGPMKVPTSGTSVFNPYTATLSAGTTVNAGLTPDLLIGKYRAGTDNPRWVDRLRGFANATGGTNPELYSNETTAESTSTAWSYNWNNTGYVIGNALNGLNSVIYAIKRSPSFFDVVCYTGTGANQVVTHNLGVVPELIIIKARTDTTSWNVYASSIGSGKRLFLQTTGAVNTLDGYAALSSTTFTTGVSAQVCGAGTNFVAYLFATCAGVSKVGSYTGTGSTQTISCGFTGGARFVLIKRTDSTGDWYYWDTARGMVSGNDRYLFMNSNVGETNTNSIYTTTGGFEIVSTAAGINASGGTYIFLAIA